MCVGTRYSVASNELESFSLLFLYHLVLSSNYLAE